MHEALKDGHTSTEDGLFSEFKAMVAFGKLPSEWYQQDRETRILLTGGNVASGMLAIMEQHDAAQEAKARADAKGNK